MSAVFFFIIAIAILVVIHEFGHFWVARRCGVKVLRFSVGFGRPLWRKFDKTGTEYCIAAIPLGGYVKMLDEREGKVAPAELQQAFNKQSLAKRTAIVAAGPLANLIFAVVAYWLIFVAGVPGVRAIIDEVQSDSASAAGRIVQNDEFISINGINTPSWSAVRSQLSKLALNGGVAEIELNRGGRTYQTQLAVPQTEPAQDIVQAIGLTPVQIPLNPVIGVIIEGGAAEKAGLQMGDRLLTLDGKKIVTWQQWVELVQQHPLQSMNISVNRAGDIVELTVVPEEQGNGLGLIGAAVDVNQTVIPSALKTEISYNALAAIAIAISQTKDNIVTIVTTLRALVIGNISAKNLGGPIAIAQIADITAEQGLIAFISLLAILSVNLAILNLLPIPVLDGGHLVMLLIEWIKGKPLSEYWLQQANMMGMFILLSLMFFAFFNDLTRLFGS